MLSSSLDSTLLGLDPGLLAPLEAVTLHIDKDDETGILDSGATLGVSLPIPSLGNESPVLSTMKDGAVGNKITTKRRLTPQQSESFFRGDTLCQVAGLRLRCWAFLLLLKFFSRKFILRRQRKEIKYVHFMGQHKYDNWWCW